MTIAELDPEDNLLEPLGTLESRPLTRIPGGTVTIIIFVLTTVASFGLGMLAEHSIDGQGNGLAGSANSGAVAPQTNGNAALSGQSQLNSGVQSQY